MPVSVLLAHAALLSRLAAPAPYPFTVGETLSYTLGLVPFLVLATLFWSAVAFVIARRQPRMRTV